MLARVADEPTVVYTDGACRGNPGPGGWAWAEPGGAFAAGAEAQSTNQRMELRAALEALLAHPAPERVHIVSDSTYLLNCLRDKWHVGWKARGWTNKAKKPVANRDLWEPLVEEYLLRERDISLQWVKGHSGDEMNDVVDWLAVEASLTQRPRSGSSPPTTLGPADEVGAPSSPGAASTTADGRVPAGHKLVVFGHRPPELGGYEANPVADDVRRRLAELLAAKQQLHRDLVVLTGLQLGAEQLAGEAATKAGVPFVAVLPYPDPERVWPAASRQRFAELLGSARERVTLERKVPADRQQAGAALARRDGWLTKHADEAVLVWNGEDPVLARLHRKLDASLPDDVWIIDV